MRAESHSKIDYFTVTVVELQMQVDRLFMTHLLPRFGIVHSMAYQLLHLDKAAGGSDIQLKNRCGTRKERDKTTQYATDSTQLSPSL